jgi:hypothetical protein
VHRVHSPESFESPSYFEALKKVPQSHPLHKGRKTNWERQEQDTEENISMGYGTSLDSLFRGGIVLQPSSK